ncbi:MAG: FAD:protein FMN transferase [Bacillota bacterium]
MKLKSKGITIIMLVLLVLAVASCTTADKDKVELKTGYKMGTVFKVKIQDPQAEKLVEESFAIIDDIENKMSSDLVDSEINEINRAAGQQKVKVSSATYQVLSKSLEYAELSGGSFDPSIGPLVELWGIGTEEEQVPSEEEIKEKSKLIDYKQVQLLDNNQVLLSQEGMKLDVGGIAKGYAADKIMAHLQENNVQSAFIDIGGNVSVLGTKPDDELWTVGIQDPKQERGQVVATIGVADKTIVTSGNYERYFTREGTRYHHILNPETGYPAKKGIISASIITEKSFVADALSTAVYILGREEGLALVNSLDDVDAMVITDDNKIYLTSNIKDKVEILNNSDYELIKK